MKQPSKRKRQLPEALLLGAGVVLLCASIAVYQKHPGLSGSGAFPLLLSVLFLLTILTLMTKKEDKKASRKAIHPDPPLFPREFCILGGASILYCLLLSVGLNFYLATPLFIYATISQLTQSHTPRWLALALFSTAFLFVLFGLCFKVVLP